MIEEENVLCETALFTTCLVETVAHRVLAGGESAFGLLGPNHISSTCNVDSSAGLEIICNAQHALWAEPVKCSNAVRSHQRYAAQRKTISSLSVPRFSLPTIPHLQLVGATNSSGLMVSASAGSHARASNCRTHWRRSVYLLSTPGALPLVCSTCTQNGTRKLRGTTALPRNGSACRRTSTHGNGCSLATRSTCNCVPAGINGAGASLKPLQVQPRAKISVCGT